MQDSSYGICTCEDTLVILKSADKTTRHLKTMKQFEETITSSEDMQELYSKIV